MGPPRGSSFLSALPLGRAEEVVMVQQKVLVDRLLTITESARLVGRSRDWLVRRIRAGRGPTVRKVGPRGRVIRLSDLLAWLDRLQEAGSRKRRGLLGEPRVEARG